MFDTGGVEYCTEGASDEGQKLPVCVSFTDIFSSDWSPHADFITVPSLHKTLEMCDQVSYNLCTAKIGWAYISVCKEN